MSSIIFDFETLSKDPNTCVVVSMALLPFDEEVFLSDDPYDFDKLVFLTNYIKFNVEEQVKTYKRSIEQDTLDWWMKQSSDARKMIQPSKLDRSIRGLSRFITDHVNIKTLKSAYVRGASFDPVILESVFRSIGQPCPIHWAKIRDTRSFIDGLAYGTNIKNNFMIDDLKDKIVLHNPVHDVVLDVLRMQLLIRAYFSDKN